MAWCFHKPVPPSFGSVRFRKDTGSTKSLQYILTADFHRLHCRLRWSLCGYVRMLCSQDRKLRCELISHTASNTFRSLSILFLLDMINSFQIHFISLKITQMLLSRFSFPQRPTEGQHNLHQRCFLMRGHTGESLWIISSQRGVKEGGIVIKTEQFKGHYYERH